MADELKPLLDDIEKGARSLHERRPRRGRPPGLFHYTSAEGLLGIVSTGNLRATNAKYMNDRTELEHGSLVFKEVVIETAAKHAGHPFVDAFRRVAPAWVNPFEKLIDAYAVCFCEDGNQLSQWREYAARGTGFAIGLDPDKTLDAVQAFGGSALLAKCVYDVGEQKKQARVVVETVMSVVNDHRDEIPAKRYVEAATQVGGWLAAEVSPYIVAFKHPSFVEEREWRIVARPIDVAAMPEKLRVGRLGLTPYIELAIQHDGRLPLSAVVQGPTVAPTLGLKSLQMMLGQYGYAGVVLQESGIPLRF